NKRPVQAGQPPAAASPSPMVRPHPGHARASEARSVLPRLQGPALAIRAAPAAPLALVAWSWPVLVLTRTRRGPRGQAVIRYVNCGWFFSSGKVRSEFCIPIDVRVYKKSDVASPADKKVHPFGSPTRLECEEKRRDKVSYSGLVGPTSICVIFSTRRA